MGVPAVTRDIDLLKRVGGICVPPAPSTPSMFAGKNVTLFDIVPTMHGLRGFDRELKDAVRIRVGRLILKVLSPERIIAGKRAANRRR